MANLKGGSTISGLLILGKAGNDSYIPKLNKDNTLVNSLMYENVTGIGLGNTNPTEKLEVTGNIKATSFIGNLAWTNITSRPTTLSNYGITDAVTNASGVPSMSAGLDSAKPAFGTTGRIYVATDTKQLYRDSGTTWDSIGGTNSVAWTNITSKPTTLGGYGITDGTRAASSDNSIYTKDTRGTNEAPQDRGAGLYVDFKANTTNGLSDGGTYNGVLTLRRYSTGSDFSGGYSNQLATTDGNNLWMRTGTSATAWGNWVKFWHSGNFDAASTITTSTADGRYLKLDGSTTMTGKFLVNKTGAAVDGSLYTNSQLEIRASGTDIASIGFHRPNASASAIYHDGDMTTFKFIGSDNVGGYFWTTRNFDPSSKLNTNGIFNTSGQDFTGRGKRMLVSDPSTLYLNYGNDFSSVQVQSSLYSYDFYGSNIYASGQIYSGVDQWIRPRGNGGIYWESWAGGFHMTDSTWIRTYNGKGFYCANTIRGERVEAVRMILPVGTNAWG